MLPWAFSSMFPKERGSLQSLVGSLQKIAIQWHQQVTISCYSSGTTLFADLSIHHFVSTKVNDCTQPLECFDRDENRLIRYIMNVDLLAIPDFHPCPHQA